MTDRADTMLSDRFARQRDEIVAADVLDVRARAARLEDTVSRRRRLARRPRRRLLVAAAAAVVAAAAGATALADRFLGPSPALTAGVSALDRLPPVETVPDSVMANLDRHAAYAGISPSEASARMRLLRTGLGQGDLYAFRGTNGSVCMVLTGHVGSCIKETSMAEPGVIWAVSGGTPGEASAIVGLASDNVTALTLAEGGHRRSVAVINNAFYAPLAVSSDDAALALEVHFGDGSTETIEIG